MFQEACSWTTLKTFCTFGTYIIKQAAGKSFLFNFFHYIIGGGVLTENVGLEPWCFGTAELANSYHNTITNTSDNTSAVRIISGKTDDSVDKR